jgi:magnesium and cobalt transporter
MTDNEITEAKPHRSWFERLSSVLFGEPQDREQLVELLRDAQQRNLLNSDALMMIEGVLEVSLMRVRDIMIPRSQMVVIEKDATLAEILPIVIDSGHSRFPVIGENRDQIIGILLAKDLLPYHFQATDKPLAVEQIMRPATFVPESKRLDILLREFRLNHNHMALVVDEYGGIGGLITIEDVLEEIVGEIEDEYDIDEEPNIKKSTGDFYLVKALTPIDEFNQFFNTELDEEEFDTIGGLVMNKFGYLPKRGESLTLDDMQFRIISADSRRIRLVRVKKKV